MSEFTYDIYCDKELPRFDSEEGIEKYMAFLLNEIQDNIILYDGDRKVKIDTFSWRKNGINEEKRYKIKDLLNKEEKSS